MISEGRGIHADSIPIRSTTPGYPSAEIVATMKAESISIMRATKGLLREMCNASTAGSNLSGPAVAADQLHEHTSLMILTNDTAFGSYHSYQVLMLGITNWNHQSPSDP